MARIVYTTQIVLSLEQWLNCMVLVTVHVGIQLQKGITVIEA